MILSTRWKNQSATILIHWFSQFRYYLLSYMRYTYKARHSTPLLWQLQLQLPLLLHFTLNITHDEFMKYNAFNQSVLTIPGPNLSYGLQKIEKIRKTENRALFFLLYPLRFYSRPFGGARPLVWETRMSQLLYKVVKSGAEKKNWITFYG